MKNSVLFALIFMLLFSFGLMAQTEKQSEKDVNKKEISNENVSKDVQQAIPVKELEESDKQSMELKKEKSKTRFKMKKAGVKKTSEPQKLKTRKESAQDQATDQKTSGLKSTSQMGNTGTTKPEVPVRDEGKFKDDETTQSSVKSGEPVQGQLGNDSGMQGQLGTDQPEDAEKDMNQQIEDELPAKKQGKEE